MSIPQNLWPRHRWYQLMKQQISVRFMVGECDQLQVASLYSCPGQAFPGLWGLILHTSEIPTLFLWNSPAARQHSGSIPGQVSKLFLGGLKGETTCQLIGNPSPVTALACSACLGGVSRVHLCNREKNRVSLLKDTPQRFPWHVWEPIVLQISERTNRQHVFHLMKWMSCAGTHPSTDDLFHSATSISSLRVLYKEWTESIISSGSRFHSWIMEYHTESLCEPQKQNGIY